MGTLHVCGDLVMAVSVHAQEVVALVVLVVAIHLMYCQYGLVANEKLAGAALTCLCFAQSRSSGRSQWAVS